VQTRTGRLLGYEPLLRGWDRFGFANPPDALDAAEAEGILAELETVLYDVAIGSFCSLPGAQEAKLFINLSTPSLSSFTSLVAQARGRAVQIVHEISERHPLPSGLRVDDVIAAFGRHGIGIPPDDFGVGF
jgi:EAL domain-containing protein (putative c-di-GMP-specific phosphodiesterase class I)